MQQATQRRIFIATLLQTLKNVVEIQSFLQVCEREGISVVLNPPSMHSIATWQGAAIASTSRLFLPVHSIEYNTNQEEVKHKAFDYSDPQQLMMKLEQLVLAEVAHRSEALL